MMNLYIAGTSVHKGSAVHCTDVPLALRKTACCALPIHSKTIAYIDVSFSNVRPDNYLFFVCRVVVLNFFTFTNCLTPHFTLRYRLFKSKSVFRKCETTLFILHPTFLFNKT